ncbi:hypothetical protein Fcan01_23362 [Folsomia candida]|uniref:Uncharacterized protein n=1 Tax=Folsomia candida TaxID=158441 RepID=A0A226D813_FOLCA|nr:hypothetical protein Fcan01_23362 [Folsomia candida]
MSRFGLHRDQFAQILSYLTRPASRGRSSNIQGWLTWFLEATHATPSEFEAIAGIMFRNRLGDRTFVGPLPLPLFPRGPNDAVVTWANALIPVEGFRQGIVDFVTYLLRNLSLNSVEHREVLHRMQNQRAEVDPAFRWGADSRRTMKQEVVPVKILMDIESGQLARGGLLTSNNNTLDPVTVNWFIWA